MRSARLIMRKRLGQHLLKNPDVVASIVAHAAIQPGERVFEIGPGTGNLTTHLLASPAARVFAVELDARMHSALLPRVAALGPAAAAKLSCARGDFLRLGLPPFDALVANIPYQISSPVLHRLFAHEPLPRRGGPLEPREAAEAVQRDVDVPEPVRAPEERVPEFVHEDRAEHHQREQGPLAHRAGAVPGAQEHEQRQDEQRRRLHAQRKTEDAAKGNVVQGSSEGAACRAGAGNDGGSSVKVNPARDAIHPPTTIIASSAATSA